MTDRRSFRGIPVRIADLFDAPPPTRWARFVDLHGETIVRVVVFVVFFSLVYFA